jgi:glyoxylase-like metal-dependent hydrolase (beta-lactamase superfamily II)
MITFRGAVANISLAASLAGAATAATEPAEFAPISVPMEAIQVAPHAYYVRGQSGMVSTANEGFNSNAGFVVTSEGVVVFDALGTPALGQRLAEVIAGKTSQPVKRVVVSHYHSDHFYGVQAFATPDVEILAHERVRDYLATEAPQLRMEERRQSLAPWVNSRSRVVAPTRYIGGEEVFRLGGLTFRVLHAGPAHTPEDLMMMVEEEGVLFVGDLMMTGRIPYVADADASAWINAIDRVLTLKPKVVVGGHGPYSTDAVADLTTTRDYLVYLNEKLSAAFEEGLGFEEAYETIDWSRFSHLPAFEAANRGNAYQTYLNVERDALRREKQRP